MTGDRLAPRFAVEVNGRGVSTDAAAAVTEVSVTSEPDTFDQCTVTLANPYPQMRWTHDERDADVFKEGSGLVVKLGYGAALEPVFDGEITAISPSFPDSGTPTVQIEAYTRMHRLRGSPKTRTFVDMTDGEIVRKVAGEHQLELDIDDPGVRHPYVMQFNQTDFSFLLERAQRIRYELQIVGRKLRFKKGAEAALQVLTLVYGAAAGGAVASEELQPLRSFNPTMNTLRPVDHVVVRGQDPKTRELIEARAGAGDADATLGGPGKGPQITSGAFGTREQVVVDQPVASQTEAAQLAKAIYSRRALEFITGTGTAVGMPELRAGRVIRLLGLGRFSGRYYVTRSTHTIGASGYITSFAARSDSVS